MSAEIAKSLVLRNLRGLASFVRSDAAPADWMVPSDVGNVVGIYHNYGQTSKSALVLTDHAFCIEQDSGWQCVEYKDIMMVKHPSAEEKHSADSMVIELVNGRSVEILIRGGHGGVRDLWSFVMMFRSLSQL